MIDAENNRDYADFGIGEFICDTFFQNWIIHPDRESNAFWKAWMKEHPEKAGLIDESRRLLQVMRFEEDIPGEDQVQRSLAGAMNVIARGRQAGGKHTPMGGARENEGVREMGRMGENGRIARARVLWKMAAILIGFGLCTALYYYIRERHPAEQVYATDYGVIKTLYLPDSSKVVLNAHSAVHYTGNWKGSSSREVWLDGEAFFDVWHVATSSFLVHTKELTVEVLGTAFDIRQRRGKTEVVLQSGKIRVQFIHGEHADLLMSPGEKLTYDPENVSLTRTATIAEHYTSWKDKRLTDITVGEIAEYIEDNFGRKVILADPSMAAKAMGGTVLLDNLDDALFALSTVLDVNIVQKNDTLIFRPR
jgi:transmembrane sensor